MRRSRHWKPLPASEEHQCRRCCVTVSPSSNGSNEPARKARGSSLSEKVKRENLSPSKRRVTNHLGDAKERIPTDHLPGITIHDSLDDLESEAPEVEIKDLPEIRPRFLDLSDEDSVRGTLAVSVIALWSFLFAAAFIGANWGDWSNTQEYLYWATPLASIWTGWVFTYYFSRAMRVRRAIFIT